MFQRLCRGAIQISKTAVYEDVDHTPIFSLSFETLAIFKNRVELSKVDNVKSLEEIATKINNLQEEIRSSKKHIRWYRDLVHKVYCLHIYKGKDKISSMIYLEMAKVNFGEVTEVSADQVAWLSMDFSILQYNLAKYRRTTKRDKDFERNCSRLKLHSILQNALEDPSRVFVLAFLGKSYEFAKSNLDICKIVKATEKGFYSKPVEFFEQAGHNFAKLDEAEDEEMEVAAKKPSSDNSKSNTPTDDEMKENRLISKRPKSNQGKSSKKTIKTTHKNQRHDAIDEEVPKASKTEKQKKKGKETRNVESLYESLNAKNSRVREQNRVDTSDNDSYSSQDSHHEDPFKSRMTPKEEKRHQSREMAETKSSKPKPKINDDALTAKLKTVHLQDMKKSTIVTNKSNDDESEDSFVEKIFDKVHGHQKKTNKPELILAELSRSVKPSKAQGSVKATGRVKTIDSHATGEYLEGDEDERFNLPKGKLVAMLSRLEMKDLQKSQILEGNQAELETLKDDMLRLALKTQTLKSSYKSAKSAQDNLTSINQKLTDENAALKVLVETLTAERSKAQATIAELQSALESTKIDLR
jgi:hypothetical protein